MQICSTKQCQYWLLTIILLWSLNYKQWSTNWSLKSQRKFKGIAALQSDIHISHSWKICYVLFTFLIFRVDTFNHKLLFTICCNKTLVFTLLTLSWDMRRMWWWIWCWCAMCPKCMHLVECSNHEVWLYLLFNAFYIKQKHDVLTNTRILLSRYSAFYKSLLFPKMQLFHINPGWKTKNTIDQECHIF